MEEWSIDGVAASAAPFSSRWMDTIVGTDHNGAPVYGAYKDIVLSFDNMNVDDFTQWHDAASSGGSHNMDVLARDELGWRTLSGVYLRYEEPPAIEDIHVTPFSIRVSKATES